MNGRTRTRLASLTKSTPYGFSVTASVKVPMEALEKLTPDQIAAFMDGLHKIVVAQGPAEKEGER